jgi:hypothetical protein
MNGWGENERVADENSHWQKRQLTSFCADACCCTNYLQTTVLNCHFTHRAKNCKERGGQFAEAKFD